MPGDDHAMAQMFPPKLSMLQRTHCPACKSASSATLYSEAYSGPNIKTYLRTHYEGRATDHAEEYDYELMRCAECELTYQRYVPAGDFLSEIYDKWIPPTELNAIRSRLSLDDYRYFAEQIQFVIQHFQLPPHAIHVLDFGFGWAEWARMAAAYGCNVTGAELSIERIQHARSIGLETVDFVNLPKGKFHFINTEQVFEHLVQPREILEGLVAALAPNGILKISVPNARSAIRKLTAKKDIAQLSRHDFMTIAPLEHINAFEYSTLVALGNAAGLKLLKPGLIKLYNCCSGIFEARNAVRLFGRQFYRHVYPKSTFLYFTRSI